MSFKSDNQTLSFSDLELSREKARNHTLEYLKNLDQSIGWSQIESTLLENYPTGKNKKGPQAYSPLMLFKCQLLRNWFQIRSDVELESLINDRFSFKKFIGLPLGNSAPDSSTFSRFRKRLTLEKYGMVLSDISDQLSCKNIIINMGSTTDIRVIKSSRPSETKKEIQPN
ncbi:MAG: transposase [Desulfobacula sp.]|uniref:transposase n=1 Tax=Desulfobacula sp. TaxID=2593537 RepID=UPI0025B9BB41|nr:transposase [Desulfobacula sp.]MCD4723114.1 transposase [Desulfobacula sp.]